MKPTAKSNARSARPTTHLRSARMLASIAMFSVLAVACSSSDAPSKLQKDPSMPDTLLVQIQREDVGAPITEQQRSEFTKKITGFWKDVDYFRWAGWHSHGLDKSYNPNMPWYSLWWQDTVADKKGDTVTFRHVGAADNLMIRTSKVLVQAAAGYLASKDPSMRALLLGYSRGIVALFKGMVWSNGDSQDETVMARAIFTHNHSYVTDDGRHVAIDYAPIKKEKFDWNAHTVPNDFNPFYGKIWVRNMRSKDDVPHILRTVPWLRRVAEKSQDDELVRAARDAADHLEAFAKDIVDHEYKIQTREDGRTYIPKEDLASFTTWDRLLPDAECDAKLSCSLVAYGEPRELDCGNGINKAYEDAAGDVHYFNLAIIRYFHLAAITNALAHRENETARKLLEGLVERADGITSNDKKRQEVPEWDPDAASFLVAAGATGLPLTSAEAALIQEQYSASVDHYKQWKYWDLWSDEVPDGSYSPKPSRDGDDGAKFVRVAELTYLIEYCQSPWRHPSSIDPVDCDVVLDPNRWGQ